MHVEMGFRALCSRPCPMQMPTKLHITSPDPLVPTGAITHLDRLAARFFLVLGLLSLYQLQGREMEIWTNFSLESCGEMHEEQVWTWHRPLISIVGRRLITAHKVHKGET